MQLTQEKTSGGLSEATAYFVSDFDLLFLLLFGFHAHGSTADRIEQRYNEIPEERRPPRELIHRMLSLRNTTSADGRAMTQGELVEFISGLDRMLERCA